MQNRVLTKIAVFLLVIFILFLTTACNNIYIGYQGQFSALYSEAVYSLLGVRGYWVQESHYRDPQIKIVEEDKNGRIMFAYCEDSNVSTLNLLILQKSDEQFAYFYPDINFISVNVIGLADTVFNNNIMSSFSEHDRLELKNLNDWGEPIFENKCIKVAISNKKVQPSLDNIKENSFDYLCQKVARENGCKGNEPTVFRIAIYCTTDNYGKILYCVEGVHRDVNGTGISQTSQAMYFDLAIIFNPDGSYNEDTCVLELKDKYNYQDELKAFKESNHWNQPF